jgi:hypothetical protein
MRARVLIGAQARNHRQLLPAKAVLQDRKQRKKRLAFAQFSIMRINSLIGMAPILYTFRVMHALPAISMAIKGSENDE